MPDGPTLHILSRFAASRRLEFLADFGDGRSVKIDLPWPEDRGTADVDTYRRTLLPVLVDALQRHLAQDLQPTNRHLLNIPFGRGYRSMAGIRLPEPLAADVEEHRLPDREASRRCLDEITAFLEEVIKGSVAIVDRPP